MFTTIFKKIGYQIIYVALALSLFTLSHANTEKNIDDSNTIDTKTKMVKSDRFDKGLKKLNEITNGDGEKIFHNLNEISPSFAKYSIEYIFGDIISREGLDMKSKEIAIISAFIAMGSVEPQLKTHFGVALNAGWTINELKEIVLQMVPYAGFPATINAMNALSSVLKNRLKAGIKDVEGDTPSKEVTIEDRYNNGAKNIAKLDPNELAKLENAYKTFTPDLLNYIVEFVYSDVNSRNLIDAKQRQFGIIAALVAKGNAKPQLKFQINAGLNLGLSADEIKEIMILMTVYSGFPTSINGIVTLQEVLNERNSS